MRVTSPPNFHSCLPRVQVKLSAHSKVARCSLVGPWGEGPTVKLEAYMMGGAVPLGSSGFTLVKPRAAGEVVVVGTPCKVAKRFAAKRNSLSFPPPKVCVQVKVPI